MSNNFANQNSMRSWRKGKLSDLATEIRVTYEPTKSVSLPYIGLEHIEKNTLLLNSIGDSSKVESSKRKFEIDDVLFGSLRPYFKKVYKPMFSGVCSTDITVLRAKSGVEASFLEHVIASYEFIQIASNYSNGSRMPRAKWTELKRLNWYIPGSDDQIKIGTFLESFIKLIEINLRRIEILQEIASLLYREWFVEFRFPGYEKIKFIDSEFGQIPEGWKVINVKDVLSFKKGFEPGSNEYVNRDVDSDYVNFYRVGDLESNGKSTFYIKKDTKGMHLCEKKDILLSLDGSLGKVAIGLNGAYSSGIRKVLPKEGSISRGFIYFWLKSKYVQDMINTYAKGSTILHAGNVINYLELAYNEKLYEEFAKLIDPIFELILNLQMQNKTLESIRDLLLPKLMSGEIDVSKLDININEK